jgi:hypothetical protein
MTTANVRIPKPRKLTRANAHAHLPNIAAVLAANPDALQVFVYKQHGTFTGADGVVHKQWLVVDVAEMRTHDWGTRFPSVLGDIIFYALQAGHAVVARPLFDDPEQDHGSWPMHPAD